MSADGEHASYDSISFLDKNTILVGEDRGDGLHTSLNALDSTWAFDLTQPLDKSLSTAQRLIAQGRDPEATDDVAKKEGTPPVADQNDGDNEVTGVLVSNGVSTIEAPFGTTDPAKLTGTRIFYTGQHGANVTYEVLPPAGPPGHDDDHGDHGHEGHHGGGPHGHDGPTGPQGKPGANGHDGKNGKNGVTILILCKVSGHSVTCSAVKSSRFKKRTRARLTRNGVVYARGTLAKLTRVHTVVKGRKYTLVLGSGKGAQKVTVTVR